MKSEICSRCGEETLGVEKCSSCREVFKFLCPECNVIYKKYHSICSEISKLGKIVIE